LEEIKNQMIAIIDYGMANLHSVQKGFEKVGHRAVITSDPQVIATASGVVLPGVGAFRVCMDNLVKRDLVQPLYQWIDQGKPFLGICVGLQLLFTESEEFGNCKGLDIFKGKVKRFSNALKVPHMGWNNITLQRPAPIFQGIEDRSYFYFVHSYYVDPEEPEIIAATTDYGISFTSVIWKDHIFGCQFHPEKSQTLGLRILKNFGDWALAQSR
jgi:glutamine amidotransferase